MVIVVAGHLAFDLDKGEKMIPDWSSLPIEILELIVKRLQFFEDYASFGMVCNSWRRVIVQSDSSLGSFLPCLILSQKIHTCERRVCYPYKDKDFGLHLPLVRDKRCWGSSFGWLVTLDCNFKMCLLNPLSREQILLPRLDRCPNLKKLICTGSRFRDSFVNKVVLSSSPSSSDCVVLAIYSGNDKMAITNLGDDAWTPLESSPGEVDDAICFGQNIYIISNSGNIVVSDFKGSSLKKIVFTPFLEEGSDPEDVAAYLVEIGGDIYVISRVMYDTGENGTPFHPSLKTWRFGVYKLDLCNEKWTEVQSLDDWSIFVGNNNSFSICCTDYPECRRSCVYFTDDYAGASHPTPSGYDVGVYNIETQKLELIAQEDISDFRLSVPLWFMPCLP